MFVGTIRDIQVPPFLTLTNHMLQRFHSAEVKQRALTNQMSSNTQLKTAAEVWSVLRNQGISARSWAKENGFEPTLVYSVLSGTRKCLRGKSHEVAKALGIK
jgi:gp16 family phage-associated protein